MPHDAAVARTPAQRGTIGNWLLESRLSRGYTSQAKARAEIERLTGWRIAQSVYAEWESGRRVPEGDNFRRLQEFFGPVPSASNSGGQDQAALILAISSLVEQLQADREHRNGSVYRRLEALEQEVTSLRSEWSTWKEAYVAAEAELDRQERRAGRTAKPPAGAPR